MGKSSAIRRVAAGLLLVVAVSATVAVRLAARHAKTKVLGLNRVIAFTYGPPNFDPKQLHSVTLVGPVGPTEWKYWRARGVVAGGVYGWTHLIRSPMDKAVAYLAGQDFGGNPQPVAMIDEFGFDYGGNIDQRSAQVLRQVKLRMPDLALAVFDMRGPIPQVLAEAYRDGVDLVMMESYVGSPQQYWLIATQAWSARKYGILPKTIFVLGLGKGGNPGEDWAETKEELERQIRFVRLIAPESPGIGFFGGNPEMLASADALSGQFFHIPTNGSGLPAEAVDLARTFTRRYPRPTLVVSPSFVEPNFTADATKIADPRTMRAYLINLGGQDATNVKIRLRNRPNLGGNVFAEGVVPLVPRHGDTVAVLRITDLWREWVGAWILEVDAPDCDVITFKPDAPTK
jgi:hypothetical protein